MAVQPTYIVVGAGMAGASIAALLSQQAQVVLLEREPQPGYHSTGRSAALFSEIYGNATIRALSRASRDFFLSPPEIFGAVPLVKPRGTLFIANAEQREKLELLASAPDVAAGAHRVTPAEAKALCPALRDDFIQQGLYEPASMDLEVHEIHQGYLRILRRNGGTLVTDAAVTAIERSVGRIWRVTAGAHVFEAPTLVNAAGAWADQIARMAGATPVGLEPRRRTVALVAPPDGSDIDRWPLIIDAAEQFYVKPDAGLLLISPADETPSEPADVFPDDLDVAIGIHRAEAALTLNVQRTKKSWAGLRSFVSDRSPVVGYDQHCEGFFWMAGQGGYGIQIAPALARAAASIVFTAQLPDDLQALGVSVEDLSPARLISRLGAGANLSIAAG